ncbi:cytochrome P450, partial [Sparassis latifolia]|uniref:Cytochrome P450 n=1 Tax=Sparassis crispa TaxID=139825 RepID=A0A401GL00_9APHY|nr:hypothetical protein SCP_0412110 [Sparassis crispa]GBE82824.1 hypothetical protein SCP_0412110 [Sparassis crispa]
MFYAFCIILITLPPLVYTLVRIHRLTRKQVTIYLTDFTDIRALLAPSTSLTTQLITHAIPNARFRQVFGICSPFTTWHSHTVHTSLTTTTTALITQHGAPYPWPTFAAVARYAIDAFLPYHVDRPPIAFDTFIQILTLRTILIQLLGANPADLVSEHDLAAVTHGIGVLWHISDTGSVMLHLLSTITGHLHRWLPMYENPIELVTPAYEAIWRVVAIAVAYANRDPAARQAFEAFMTLPDAPHFRTRVGVEDLSVEMFILEVLRLHPPTRYITLIVRVDDSPFPFPIPGLSRDVTVVADIEAVQRDADIWGDTANGFDSTRFHPDLLTPSQEQSMFAFGRGRLSCVARNWAPHAAAVLAGAVLERIGPESEFRLIQGSHLGHSGGWFGWKVCEAV